MNCASNENRRKKSRSTSNAMFESILSFAQCVNHRQRREMLNYISNPSSSPPRSSSLSRTGKTSNFYSNEQQLKKTSTENLHTFHKNRRNHVWFECDIALTANEVEKEKKNFQTRSKFKLLTFISFGKIKILLVRVKPTRTHLHSAPWVISVKRNGLLWQAEKRPICVWESDEKDAVRSYAKSFFFPRVCLTTKRKESKSDEWMEERNQQNSFR